MTRKIGASHPAIQKLIHGAVDEALLARAIDFADPVRAELFSRADVSFGYRDQPLVCFRAPDATLLSAGACLDHLLSKTEHTAKTPPGPTRIPWSDKEALFNADPSRISRGEIVVY